MCRAKFILSIQLVKIQPSELNLTSSLIGNSREEAREIGYEFHSTISSLERENANFRVLIFQLFSLSEYYDTDRRKYYDAIQSVRENEMDMTTWLEYFTEGLKSQLVEVKIKGEKAIKRDVLIEKAKGLNVNEHQQKILLHFLDVNRSSVEEMRKELNLVRRTVQRDLSKMVTLGLIKEIAKSKTDPTKYYELL